MMVVDEDYFPRGKPKEDEEAVAEDTTSTDKKARKEKKAEKKFVNVFSEKDGKIVKKKKNKKDKKDADGVLLKVKSAPAISYDQLREGMTLSGVVSEVSEYEVKVSLPCHLVASLPLTNISTTLTDRLRKLANEVEEDDEEDNDEVPSLDQIFKVGQFIVVAVVSCVLNHNKWDLTVSTDPRLVMAGNVPGEGDLICGSIMSEEDHGYMMDVGNSTVRGFLSKKAAQKHWTDKVYVGQVILCQVVKKDKGAVTLKCDPGKVYNNPRAEPNINNSLPGTLFKAKIEESLANGLKVVFGKGLTGYVSRDLLPLATDSPADFNVGSELSVRLVHVLPTVNTALLSAKSIYPLRPVFGDVKVGESVESAKIVAVAQRSLTLRLNENVHGFVSARNAKDGEPIKNLKDKYKTGDSVRARVLGLDYFSGLAACSLQKSVVKGINKLDQLTVGQKVRGTVKGFVEKGLEVTIGSGLVGFIPHLYLSDVPLKNPQKKFFPGDKIDCRVLLINLEKRRLHLTSKPILVKYDFDIVSSFETATLGTITEGVVTKISKDGLLINLFGDVRGFAPRRALSTETIEFPEKLFFVGQAVKCQVIGCEPEKKRISLSLIIGTMNPLGKKEKAKGKILALGKEYTGKVTDVSETGLDLEVQENGQLVKCTIPTNHLTDNIAVANLLLHAFQVGDDVTGLCYNHDVVTQLSLKQSIRQAAKSGTLPEGFDDIEVGSILPASAQVIKPYGVFCRMPTWAFRKNILVPTRHLANFFVEKAEDIIDIGQTLIVKVTEKNDDDGQKLAGSTNVKDFEVKADESAAMTKSLLEDLDFIRERDARLAKYKIGSLLTGTVKEVSDTGAILDVEGVIAVAPRSSFGDEDREVKTGNRIPVMVVFLDFQAGVMEVSLDASIIHRAALSNKIPEIGSNVRGKIILTRTELNLQIVSITNPAKYAGSLVYLSTVSHINDFAGDQAAGPTSINVVIQRVSQGEIIGVNEMHLKPGQRHSNKPKRERTNSIGEDRKLMKKMRTESESSAKEVTNQSTPATVADAAALVSAPEAVPKDVSVKKEKKKRKKKDKEDEKEKAVVQEAEEDAEETADEMDVDPEQNDSNDERNNVDKEDVKIKTEKAGLADPGWDFSLTGVTLPAWGKVSIWDEEAREEEEAAGDNSTSRLNKKEAKKLRRQELAAAEVAEKKVVLGETLPPQSPQEFEKLVVASPSSSLVWIQYMAFHLQTCQYDQARAVAARAVERINFREETERLNVYLAWLNLENTFGNQESLAGVLKDALQRNDEFKIYSQMADIYSKSGKMEEAEKMFKILVKKFCRVKEVWIRYGLFHYKNSKLEEGRFVFTRSLQNLEAREATDISAKFAQIEFRYGDVERGKTMYEKLVVSHPKRIDLWSSYADQLVRVGDIAAARVLYNRIATLGLQAKKMKPLFGKWLDFENIHGTEEQQNLVKQAALQYLNSRESGTAAEPMEA